ncbi:hypothetical protein AB0F92_31920 [Kitasatospora aureofaciens]|uniref:hypothetical protein n=1 Tax=Kitasatospora aureofaciens TaxID=1894 RepID=UPI0033F2754A
MLVDAILERQIRNVRFWAEQPPADHTEASASVVASRIRWSRLAHAFVHTHRRTFDQALNALA